MAYTTINKHTDYFNTKLYTGNGSTNAITGVGFQPDWTLLKDRDATSGTRVYDSVRGVIKRIRTDTTDAQVDDSDGLTAFGTDGFTLGADGATNANSNTYVAWNWKAGTTGSGTTTGTGTAKAYSYSVNTAAGFSIIKYLGNGNAGQQIPHHLGAVPHLILLKPLDRTDNWRVYHHNLNMTSPANYQLKLNSTNTIDSGSDVWNDTIPTSTYFTLGSNAGVVTNDENFIAYCFTQKTGYSKFGRYAGNGSSSSPPFIYTGFKPTFVITKKVSGSSDHWYLVDDKRIGYNEKNYGLYPNLTNVEYTGNAYNVNLYSNGFSPVTTDPMLNGDGVSYVYIAFGQTLVGSNNVVTNAR